MNLHEETLSRRQVRALHLLGPLMRAEGFYLAGGTAIALHLGHRRSVDLDWFTGDRLANVEAFARRLQDRGAPIVVESIRPGTLHGRVFNTRVTFLEYRYPLLAAVVPSVAHNCDLASLDDLGCMKLAAIAQRGAKKDFVDLYALGTQHRPLASLLEAYQRKYRVADLAHVLCGLAYFDDADKDRMPPMLWDLDWRTVKRTIRGWITEAASL